MITLLLLPAALANPDAPPEAEAWLTWRRGGGVLEVRAPAGEHLAPDAPVDGWVGAAGRRVEIATDGRGIAPGYPVLLGDAKAHAVAGHLKFSLCEDEGTACRVAELGFAADLAGRKGAARLPPGAPEGEADAPSLAHAADAEAAFVAAAASGRRVLLDFSAVWCPPCQVLAAELLHDPAEAEVLGAFEVVELDADDPASFDLKSRYEVGGYPTMIIAEPDGALVARMVGYPGEEETRSWLAAGASELEPLESLLARVEGLEGDEALAAARRLSEEGLDEEAAAALERAGEGDEQRLLRFSLEPTAEELLWLAENAPERLEDWLWSGYSLLTAAPAASPAEGAVEALDAARDAVLDALATAIHEVDPIDGADLAYVAGSLAADVAAPVFYGAGASLLRAGLSGDPDLDRGHYTFLATLLEKAGDPDAAHEVLVGAIASFPQEFTYHYADAGLLLRAERHDEALAAVRAAAGVAYGDMSLRAAGREAKVLEAMERVDEAAGVLRAAIEAAERPAEGLKVRTWRYLELLEEQLAALEGGDDAEG